MLRRLFHRVWQSNIRRPPASVTGVMYATGAPYNLLLNDAQVPLQFDVDWAQLSRQWIDQQLAPSSETEQPFSQYSNTEPLQPFSQYCSSNPAFVAENCLPNQSVNQTANHWSYNNNVNQDISWYNFVPDPASFYERFYALSGRSSSPHSADPRESRGSSPVDVTSKTYMPDTSQVTTSEVSCPKDDQSEHKSMPRTAPPKDTRDGPRHKQQGSATVKHGKETSSMRNKRKKSDERKSSEQSHKHRRRSPEAVKKNMRDFEDLLKKILGEDSSSRTLMDMYTHLDNTGRLDFMDKMKSYRNRQWHFTEFGHDFKKQQRRGGRLRSKYIDFKLMSYNVLSQDLLEGHPHLYQHCPSQWLKWHYRSRNLLQEITDQFPDVLCLQEVNSQHYESFYYPKLSKLGYGGVFQQRTGDKKDGCATFYRKSKFELEKSVGVEYYQPEVELLDRDNIGLLVLLRPHRLRKQSEVRLCVANTHLLFNPRRGDVKLVQLMKLFSEIDKLAFLRSLKTGKPLYHPIIFCGDLNLLPHSDLYKFIVEGHMKYEGMPIKPMSGQDFYGDKSRYLDKELVCSEAGMTDHCIYVSQLQNRLDLEHHSQAQAESPPNLQAQAEVPPNIQAQADMPPNTQAQVELPPNTQAQADLPPDIQSQADLAPDTQAQADLPPDTQAQAELPPDTMAQVDLPPDKQAEPSQTTQTGAELPPDTQARAEPSQTTEAQSELPPNTPGEQSHRAESTSADLDMNRTTVDSEVSASSSSIIDLTQPDEVCVDMTQADVAVTQLDKVCVDLTHADEGVDMTQANEGCVDMTQANEGCVDMTQANKDSVDMTQTDEDRGAVGGNIHTHMEDVDKGWQTVGNARGNFHEKSPGRETKPAQPQMIQSSGNIYNHFDLVSSYGHSVQVGSKFEDLVTTFHSVDKCGVDYIFYSVYSKDVVNSKKGRIDVKHVKEGKLKLLGTLRLLSESQIDKLGPLPNEFISSDHLNLMCKFALKMKS